MWSTQYAFKTRNRVPIQFKKQKNLCQQAHLMTKVSGKECLFKEME